MGGKVGGDGQVKGYKYLFSILMGLCRGPVNEVVEVRAGDRTAWTGAADDNRTVQINSRNLFGGDDKEGGLVGQLTFHQGAANQVLEDGFARATLTFSDQPNVGDTVTIGTTVFEFVPWAAPPPDGTSSEGSGPDGGEAEG
jgi:hypothetical protein